MKSLIILTLALTVLFPSFARADRIGNGGGIWACQTSSDDLIVGMLVDLYEAETQYHLPLISTNEADPNKIADARYAYLNSFWPELATTLAPYFMTVRQKWNLVDGELAVIPGDVSNAIIPLAKDCNQGKWSYLQFANFQNGEASLLIRRDFWQSDRIATLDKAALIWHEAVYLWLRKTASATDSVVSRHIVGLIFSEKPAQELKSEIQTLLGSVNPPAPPPPPPGSLNFVCAIENGHESSMYIGRGTALATAKFNAKNSCQTLSADPFFCQDSTLRCDQEKSPPSHFLCVMKNNQNSKVYSGEGSTSIEAEYLAKQNCAKGGDIFFCRLESPCVQQ